MVANGMILKHGPIPQLPWKTPTDERLLRELRNIKNKNPASTTKEPEYICIVRTDKIIQEADE